MELISKVKGIFAGREGWTTEPTERASYYSYFAGQNMIYTLFNVCLTTYLLFLSIGKLFVHCTIIMQKKIDIFS